MDLREYIRDHRPEWEAFEALLRQAERRGVRTLSAEELERFGREHRRLNADYACLETFYPGSRPAQYLNALVARAHAIIYRKRGGRLAELRALLLGARGAFRAHLRVFGLVVGLFVLSILLGYELTLSHPEAASVFLPPRTLAAVREGHLWTKNILNVMPASWVSTRVLANNLSVLISAFVLGLTVVGTAWVVFLNGFMLGCLVGFCEPYGQAGALLTFTLAHGPLEISAILISAMAGLMLARAVASPGLLPRGVSLSRASGPALSLFAVALIALGVAALLEGFVSTDDGFPAWARGLVGFSGAAALFVFLLKSGGREDRMGVAAGRTEPTPA